MYTNISKSQMGGGLNYAFVTMVATGHLMGQASWGAAEAQFLADHAEAYFRVKI